MSKLNNNDDCHEYKSTTEGSNGGVGGMGQDGLSL